MYFLSDSTGITAQALGNALLVQFPSVAFERHTFPFIDSAAEAHRVVETMDEALDATPEGGIGPIVFSTAVSSEIRAVLHQTRCEVVDLFGAHVGRLEEVLGATASWAPGRAHGVGDLARYDARMRAVEYAIEHDDGQSLRALQKAQVILIAPSRCGKTPTTMYLALQHGIFVANYPLIDEDFGTGELPAPIAELRERCFGLVATPQRLSQVRSERRPNSRYASLEQCIYEVREAEALYRAFRIPTVNTTTKSVEEMSTIILHTLGLTA